MKKAKKKLKLEGLTFFRALADERRAAMVDTTARYRAQAKSEREQGERRAQQLEATARKIDADIAEHDLEVARHFAAADLAPVSLPAKGPCPEGVPCGCPEGEPCGESPAVASTSPTVEAVEPSPAS